MSVKITKGWGGPQGVRILIGTCIIGVTLLLLAYALRWRILAAGQGVVATEMPREKVLALGEQARGPMNQVSYVGGDMARVATFAAAKLSQGEWDGLAAGTIIQVASSTITNGETWVNGTVQGGVRKQPVMVHASFLERYLPVILPEKTMEVSDLR